ncbi:MAG: DNA cytosine methyltransferase [Myxococcales bacterium]|nr:DNA cytosine methyltransferase [Myxococcales bacterium]
MTHPLRIGSLFSGVGGLELGVLNALRGLAVDAIVAWQCEKDRYARAVLQRYWPETPCFEDVHDVDASASPVDLICGGFPCQDLSIAGGRAGIDGDRSGLWREFARVVRVLRPRVVFVENVPELALYLGAVLGPLAELGFDAEWGLFSAAEVGAPHLRERLFLLAHAAGERREVGQRGGARAQHAAVARPRCARVVANADGVRQLQPAIPREGLGGGAGVCGAVPDADRIDLHQQHIVVAGGPGATLARGHGADGALADADGLARRRHPAPWPPEPDVGRVVDGASTRLDARRRRARLRCLGNGVVPQTAELAFLTLAARAGWEAAP